ncbi:MAG: hypothetical protein Q9M34_04440, partial [Sulfurimonas sp.]|nr:hypothetical protein [Sulfurimonas sp.]
MKKKNLVLLSLSLGLILTGCGGSSDGDENSDSTVYHNQGINCLSCHKAPAAGAEGYSFLSGGTIYTELNATTAAQYATGYTI